MKRSIVLSLLSILAVATIFATTSCTGKTILGSDIPKEPGDYLNLGNGWQKIPPDVSVFPVWLPAAEFDRLAIPIPKGCQSIKNAHRFTPTEVMNIGSYFFQSRFGHLELCSARKKEKHLYPGEYEYETGDIHVQGSQYDHSVYEGKDPYILLEYPLPDYPPGEYFLDSFGTGYICLRRQ